MGLKSDTAPMETNCFYHVYNRGINGENIFREEKNYNFFLKKYAQYISPIADTYAYCLLKNHFHLLIQIKSEETLLELFPQKQNKRMDEIISLPFSHFFNSYAQAFNKAYQRTGGLFETPFRRKKVNDDAYFTQLIYYIHSNPQKHGFIDDFRAYPFSSYLIYESVKSTKLSRESGLAWFEGLEQFKKYHEEVFELKDAEKFVIEFD